MSEKDVTEVTATTDTAVDEVAAKLVALGLTNDQVTKVKEDLGVATVEDLSLVTEEDLKGVGLKPIAARRAADGLKPVADATAPAVDMAASLSVLPQVPNYTALLQMLKVGGVLRFEQSTVIAGIQAYLADKAGVYGINKALAAKMLAYAKSNRQSVDPVYHKLKTEIARTGDMAELFAAIEGFDGRSVTATARKELFGDIDKYLIPAVNGFWSQLDSWMQAALVSANGPAATQRVLNALVPGAVGGFMPSGGNAAPPTTGLHEYAEKVNDAANQAFAGEGAQIASGALCQANALKGVLDDPTLPAKVGAVNSEQMLLELGVTVTGADARVENDLAQFVTSILQVKNLSGGDTELRYFDALWQLGSLIPWNQLGGRGGYSSLGGKL